MAHPPRRWGVLVVLALVGAGMAGVAWAAEPQPPAVTFAPVGACSSRPDVTSIEVPEGTAVLFVNHTGGDATVLVGEVAVLEDPVPHGEGALLTLAPGQHGVRMVPACGGAEAVTVRVTPAGATSPSPSAVASAPPPRPTAAAGAPGDGPVATDLPPAGPEPGGSPALVPAATTAIRDPAGPTPTAVVGAGPPRVLAANQVDLAGGSNPKAVLVLGAVATICVLGVTAAIIRSIVRLSP